MKQDYITGNEESWERGMSMPSDTGDYVSGADALRRSPHADEGLHNQPNNVTRPADVGLPLQLSQVTTFSHHVGSGNSNFEPDRDGAVVVSVLRGCCHILLFWT